MLLSAQDVAVRSYLNSAQVASNQQFVLSVEISGVQRVDRDPMLPDMSGFATYLGSSSSSQMQIINGRTSVSITLQYRFLAIAEGNFEIPPVQVEVNGQAFATDPLQIEIMAGAAPGAPQSPRRPAGAPQGGEVEIAPEDLFITATVSKARVHQGEPVIVEYRIYTRVSVSSYSVTKSPGTAGFWAEEYPQPPSPAVDTEVRNGMQYAAATIKKTALFATSAGRKTIDPMTVEAQVRVRRRSFDVFDDFFRGGSLLGRNVATLLSSEAIEVEVLPLPEAGRPAEFGGLVGDLGITASVDKVEAETNEAITLSVRVEGEGNIRTLPEPTIDFPADFEVYPPEISEQVDWSGDLVTGRKTFEYVLIPRAPGRRTIPAIEFSYFDPARGSYELAASTPIAVEVTGEPVLGPVAAGRARGAIEPLREDIRFINIREPSFQPVDRSLVTELGFWVVFLVPLTIVAGALGVRRHRDRLQGDVAYARRRRASRVARKRLSRARALLNTDTQREFFAETGKALQGFIGDKLNIAEAGLIREDVRTRLAERGVSDEVTRAYFDCLGVCDRQRFAPSGMDAAEMQAFLARAEQVMTDLDREITR
jgi:hypothetical protein